MYIAIWEILVICMILGDSGGVLPTGNSLWISISGSYVEILIHNLLGDLWITSGASEGGAGSRDYRITG